MNKREEQAFNDGRAARAAGHDLTACTRRAGHLRALWIRGYEHERRLRLADTITPEQRAESEAAAESLRQWLADHLP